MEAVETAVIGAGVIGLGDCQQPGSSPNILVGWQISQTIWQLSDNIMPAQIKRARESTEVSPQKT